MIDDERDMAYYGPELKVKTRCHVVGGPDCTAASDDANTRAECFACGNPVCTAPCCSKRMDWYSWGVRRVCLHCQEDERR